MAYKLKTGLLPHQEEAVYFHIEKLYSGNFGEMGVGKSLMALASIIRSKEKALVVCPPFLVKNWMNEIRKHTELAYGEEIFVCPYTQLEKYEETFKNVEFVVADEGHYLKNLDAKRTQRFHAFMYQYPPKYFIYATGTPIKNRIPEIYSMLVLFSQGPNRPKIIEHYKSFYTFCCRFTNVRQTQYGTKFEGMKNVEELRQFINPFVIRHTSEVLNLPELTESSVVVKYDKNSALEKEFRIFQEKGVGANVTVKRDSAIAKAHYTAQLAVNALESDQGPIVIFSDHVSPLDILKQELSEFRVDIITGKVPPMERQDKVDKLNNGQLDVLLCSIGAASSGYNMTKANLIIINDPPWVPGDLDQVRKRIHRMGQDKPCRIVHVIGSDVDETILRSLRGKNKVIKEVVKA